MRGLLGRASLPAGEGILLRPAGSVHTFFMRFPIDVVFLDRDEVVRRDRAVDCRRGGRPAGAARRPCVELAAGECERRGVQVGDRLMRCLS